MQPGHGLDARVLVLNKYYMVVRVVSARHAFRYLCKFAAEVVDRTNGHYDAHSLSDWIRLSREAGAHGTHNGNGNGNGNHDDWVRTASVRLKVPRIIRLLEFDRAPRRRIRPSRRNVFARDEFRCQYCRTRLPGPQLTVDHVQPRARGGKDEWTNLVTACLPCNDKKGDRTPEGAGMPLAAPPLEPKSHPELTLSLRDERYQAWKPFV